jgi:hypothetical protein
MLEIYLYVSKEVENNKEKNLKDKRIRKKEEKFEKCHEVKETKGRDNVNRLRGFQTHKLPRFYMR